MQRKSASAQWIPRTLLFLINLNRKKCERLGELLAQDTHIMFLICSINKKKYFWAERKSERTIRKFVNLILASLTRFKFPYRVLNLWYYCLDAKPKYNVVQKKNIRSVYLKKTGSKTISSSWGKKDTDNIVD